MPDTPTNPKVSLPVPDALIEALANAVADRVARHVDARAEADRGSPWMDIDQACAYLALSKDAVYKLSAVGGIPVRKKAGGQGLRFHRDEVDAWMDEAYPRVDRLG